MRAHGTLGSHTRSGCCVYPQPSCCRIVCHALLLPFTVRAPYGRTLTSKRLLSNGGMHMEFGDVQVVFTYDTLNRLIQHGLKLTALYYGDNGYLYADCFKVLHQFVLTDAEKNEHMVWLRERGWTPTETDPIVVMHLNDNRLDLRVENLFWGPRSLNMLCRKTRAQLKQGSYHGGYKCTYTKSLKTLEEGCHAMDCLKMSLIQEQWRLEFVFMHGLVRPTQFEEFYTTPEDLQRRFHLLYEPRHNTVRDFPPAQRKFSTVAVSEMAAHDLNDAIMRQAEVHTALPTAPGVQVDVINALIQCGQPFDPATDVIYVYTGARGRTIQGCVERQDFCRYLEEYTGTVHLTLGYPMLAGKPVHMLCADRVAGDTTKDKLVVRHRGQQKLDARKRFLTVGTYGENARDVERKRKHSAYKGAYRLKKRWNSRITIDGANYNLGTYDTEEEAASKYSRIVECMGSVREELSRLDGVRAKRDFVLLTACYPKTV